MGHAQTRTRRRRARLPTLEPKPSTAAPFKAEEGRRCPRPLERRRLRPLLTLVQPGHAIHGGDAGYLVQGGLREPGGDGGVLEGPSHSETDAPQACQGALHVQTHLPRWLVALVPGNALGVLQGSQRGDMLGRLIQRNQTKIRGEQIGGFHRMGHARRCQGPGAPRDWMISWERELGEQSLAATLEAPLLRSTVGTERCCPLRWSSFFPRDCRAVTMPA